MSHSDTGERVLPCSTVVLKAGESFYEPPGALHSVSRNARQELPGVTAGALSGQLAASSPAGLAAANDLTIPIYH